MSQKFCRECKQEIAEGKEIKSKRVLEWQEHYISGGSWRRGKTVYSPARTATYYLCPECYEKIEREIIRMAKKQERWGWIVLGLFSSWCLFLVVALIWTRKK